MKLRCEKYREEVEGNPPRCAHPGEYCRFRQACMINFLGRDSGRVGPGPATDDTEKMEQLDFDKGGGLVPAIVQDSESGEVLMLAYVNREAWEATIATGKAHYFSRSRNKLWLKGETSGHVQKVREILVDCDRDTVVFKVEQVGGAACHTGHRSCFYRRFEDGDLRETAPPVFDPKEVYGK